MSSSNVTRAIGNANSTSNSNISLPMVKNNGETVRINSNRLDNNSNLGYNTSDIPSSILSYITKTPEKTKYLPYTTLEEFYELTLEDMDRISAGISKVATKVLSKGEESGSFTDYDGKIYKFDVDSETNYHLYSIDKNISKVKEVLDGKDNKTTNRYADGNTEYGQNVVRGDNVEFQDRRQNERNDNISRTNRLEEDKNNTDNKESRRNSRTNQELEDSSFILPQNENSNLTTEERQELDSYTTLPFELLDEQTERLEYTLEINKMII